MKKGFVLSLVCAFILVAGSSFVPVPFSGKADAAEGREIVVGYVINSFNDTYQTVIHDGCVAYAEENGIRLVTSDAQEDIIKQQDAVYALITQGVDGLIVIPVDTSAIVPITQAAQDADIPLCYASRPPYNDAAIPENVYYVGCKDIEGGRMQMEYIAKLIDGRGGVCILQGVLANEGTEQRTAGNEEIIAEKYPDITVLAKESGNFQRDQGMNITQNWITAYGDRISAILSNNDEMALGACNALSEAGRSEVPVIGFDGVADAVKAIKDEKLTASIFQDGAGQGAAALKVIEAVLNGEAVQQETILPFQLITSENVSAFQ
jgi:inositol transport system substrate-binding protein